MQDLLFDRYWLVLYNDVHNHLTAFLKEVHSHSKIIGYEDQLFQGNLLRISEIPFLSCQDLPFCNLSPPLDHYQ